MQVARGELMMKRFEKRHEDTSRSLWVMPKSEAPLLKILFIGHLSTSWIGRDFELLSDFYVEPLQIESRSFHTLFKLLRHFISADIIYVWFIKMSTFIIVLLSLLFNKKTIIVTGGCMYAFTAST